MSVHDCLCSNHSELHSQEVSWSLPLMKRVHWHHGLPLPEVGWEMGLKERKYSKKEIGIQKDGG